MRQTFTQIKDAGGEPRASILLIYTGGTIGMVENPDTGALEPLDFSALQEDIPDLDRLGCDITVIQMHPPIDSSAIQPANWSELVEILESNYERFDGFVILHGTDTMSYTASALSFMLRGLQKPVILTGSQLPLGRIRTDGRENLITAISIAAARREDGRPRVPEVCIFFHNYLMRGNRTRKVSADRFRAFKSFSYPPLAFAGIDIRYNDAFIHHEPEGTVFEVYKNLETNVGVLKIFPGITRAMVEAVLGTPGLKGVVLETFGSGNAPKSDWLISALGSAIARGVIIINVSQCTSGNVDMLRYETGRLLHSLGIIGGYDITSEAALTKLMCVLGQGLPMREVRRLVELSLRGEISPDAETTAPLHSDLHPF